MLDTRLQPLLDHVARFNAGVRSGDFGAMLDAFCADAEMRFINAPAGPFYGRDNIAAAYAANPPADEIEISNARVVDDTLVADYGWRKQRTRAGELRLTLGDGCITRLVVQFE
jgi:steroid Delta-isomerase